MKNVLLVQGFRLARQNDSLSPLPERCLRGSPDMPLKDQKRHEEGGEEVGFTQQPNSPRIEAVLYLVGNHASISSA
ncbi:Hypothetical predicted protein [Podarcis lilfordi]|uniref:Uncharacterized protein n=1 Tax=Podarcis lilfordi TaxID=74358 RepID=A0AA35JU72_9SAUR|nr:Hypothetical predicted protein [Podarcis lilfordi]